MGRFLSWTNYPVYKLPISEKGVSAAERRGFSQGIGNVRDTLLFNINEDYEQKVPLENKVIEQLMIEALIRSMKEADSPEEQFERLGLNILH
jgi:hypothetical protein